MLKSLNSKKLLEMNFKNLTPLYLLITLIFGCTKETISHQQVTCEPTIVSIDYNDTIYPSEYFPAYPGSRWTLVFDYSTGQDTIKMECNGWKVGTAYAPISFNDCGSFYKYSAIIPQYSPGKFGFAIWGDSLIVNVPGEKYNAILMNFFTDQPNIIENEGYPNSSGNLRKVKVKRNGYYPSATVDGVNYNDVIIINYGLWENGHYGWFPLSNKNYYFAKGIGLIHISDLAYYKEYKLIDYYVAPH